MWLPCCQRLIIFLTSEVEILGILSHRTFAQLSSYSDRNPDGTLPVAYGTKKAFSYVHVVELLPMPLTWRLGQQQEHVADHGQPETEGFRSTPQQSLSHPAGAPSTATQPAQGGVSQRPPSTIQPAFRPASNNSRPARPPSRGGTEVRGGGTSSPWRPSYSPSLARMQAKTVELEWEVQQMEAALAAARGLGLAMA